jgi:hypothetical protein
LLSIKPEMCVEVIKCSEGRINNLLAKQVLKEGIQITPDLITTFESVNLQKDKVVLLNLIKTIQQNRDIGISLMQDLIMLIIEFKRLAKDNSEYVKQIQSFLEGCLLSMLENGQDKLSLTEKQVEIINKAACTSIKLH